MPFDASFLGAGKMVCLPARPEVRRVKATDPQISESFSAKQDCGILKYECPEVLTALRWIIIDFVQCAALLPM